jgi:prophage tail gpP-like protein
MALAHDVTLTLRDGTVVDTWSEYDVTIDMLSPGSAWTFSCWPSDLPRSTWQRVRAAAKAGEQLYLAIDGAVQLSGRIEARRSGFSDAGGRLVLTGRDLAGPAITWHAEPTLQVRGATLEQLLVRLFEPLGVSVFIADEAAARDAQALRHRRRGGRRAARHARIPDFRIHPGDTIWGAAKTECLQLGYMIWTGPYPEDGTGIGVIVAAPLEAGEPTYAFEYVEDPTTGLVRAPQGSAALLLSGEEIIDIADVPTEVTAFTHSAANAGEDTRVRSVTFNDRLVHPRIATDLVPQPYVLHADDARTLARAGHAAEHVIARAMADAIVYEGVVQGHGQRPPGREPLIYAVNHLAHIRDTYNDVNGDYLLTRVHFRGSPEGEQTTALRFVPKGLLRVVPENE